MSVIRVIKKFNGILSQHQRHRILQLFFLMIIGGFLEMCSVSLIIPFMSALLDTEAAMENKYVRSIIHILGIKNQNEYLILLAVLLAVLYVLKNLYLMIEYKVQYGFVYNNMFDMQRRLLASYLRRPYSYYLSADSGEIIRIIHSDAAASFVLLSTLLNMFTELVVASLLILTVFFITPVATILMASILVVMLLLINRIIKPILAKAGRDNQSNSAGMYKWLLQAIEGIKEIKIENREDFFQKQYDIYGFRYVKSIQKSQILSIAPRFVIEAISMGTMFIIITAIIVSGVKLQSIMPMVTAIAMAAIRLLPSINRISNNLASIAYNEPMLNKLVENLEDDSNNEDHYEIDNSEMSNCKIGRLREEIQMEKICFHYPDSELAVFNDASVRIKKGDSVGIIGKSGSGKTTAIDIILGLLEPQSGGVFVDGIDIFKDIHGWNCQIGYIPQSIFLMDGTIRDNVCFGEDAQRINDDDVDTALKEASLYEFVESLPNGVDTKIGERGIRLSGGQRQRIGIARALYKKPSVLVFDEATSALDSDTERAIMESINDLHGKKTMIIIAHRLSTIEKCDHVYVVENGKIIEKMKG